MKIEKINQLKIDSICQMIKSGQIVVLPFDTVYGLVANPFDDTAIQRIYDIKGRDFDKPIALIFSSVEMLTKYISISKDQEGFIRDRVPCAYTFILPWSKGDKEKFSPQYQKLGKIGIRIPDYKFILELVEKLDQPIAATSANVSGMENCWAVNDFQKQIRNQTEKPDLIIDTSELAKNPPSEVIDISNIENISTLRSR
ncbi:MAG: L-threonylcarbamoyladenylate synthase [Candidatus Berkelbacteria bacterium]|nr:L-threonylcarbamoyladenylate synthase [Candidatus Berkelbacteria bacterium]